MSAECHAECSLAKDGICQIAKRGGFRCNYGRFFMTVESELSGFGVWKLRDYQNGAMCATLHGKTGRVEVWGGDHHANEVWVIEKGTKRETMICTPWSANDGTLLSAVYEACVKAGITQTRMEISA